MRKVSLRYSSTTPNIKQRKHHSQIISKYNHNNGIINTHRPLSAPSTFNHIHNKNKVKGRIKLPPPFLLTAKSASLCVTTINTISSPMPSAFTNTEFSAYSKGGSGSSCNGGGSLRVNSIGASPTRQKSSFFDRREINLDGDEEIVEGYFTGLGKKVKSLGKSSTKGLSRSISFGRRKINRSASLKSYNNACRKEASLFDRLEKKLFRKQS
ncbi:7285_t:CDS:2 [Ambispora leptoticha]|uniref:7285_t:CDS:1 n=1 Tax=Ambispora leptoticha TaxID=144679 RepID=A0A9N8WIU0_9GLOM|nr:7285_t:CDS:2 [Ambispora leptoticha]